MIRPIFVMSHAAFAPERVPLFERVLADLQKQAAEYDCPVLVHKDYEAKGSLGPFLKCMDLGLNAPGTHVVYMQDDLILPSYFVKELHRAIAAHPRELLCFFPNHPKAKEAAGKTSWYTTPDGSVVMAGTFEKGVLKQFLEWRDTCLVAPDVCRDDESVNLFAMATGRKIFKATVALVDHDTTVKSLMGNDAHEFRKPAVPPAEMSGDDYWHSPPVHLGRTYGQHHWSLIYKLKPEHRKPRIAYELERDVPV